LWPNIRFLPSIVAEKNVSSPEDIIPSEHVEESLPRELCDFPWQFVVTVITCDTFLFTMAGLRGHRLRKHLNQEIKFKCINDSCTAAFCEKGELLVHQTSHGEQKRITCNYCNHKLSGKITELTRQRFFHMFGWDYIFMKH
jgi:DNA-directed RNA polymerase subunit RPC12/RpoP